MANTTLKYSSGEDASGLLRHIYLLAVPGIVGLIKGTFGNIFGLIKKSTARRLARKYIL